MVRIEVRAELMRGGVAIVEVRDNFIVGGSDLDIPPPPPEGNASPVCSCWQ